MLLFALIAILLGSACVTEVRGFASGQIAEVCRRGVRMQAPAAPNDRVILAEKESGDSSQGSIQPLSWLRKPKPPTLPANLFKPKESLSQTFLADPNYIFKMLGSC